MHSVGEHHKGGVLRSTTMGGGFSCIYAHPSTEVRIYHGVYWICGGPAWYLLWERVNKLRVNQIVFFKLYASLQHEAGEYLVWFGGLNFPSFGDELAQLRNPNPETRAVCQGLFLWFVHCRSHRPLRAPPTPRPGHCSFLVSVTNRGTSAYGASQRQTIVEDKLQQ
jgi:hypothetical protein